MASNGGVAVSSERAAALAMSADDFRALGHAMVERIAVFLDGLPERPVTRGETPSELRTILGGAGLPEEGCDPADLLHEAADLLFEHSLFNGHPGFMGYITASAAPIGALADLLAAAVNPNVGSFTLGPIATEIERQTIGWIADFLGYPAGSGGLFVSGGNMANIVGFFAARRAKAAADIRSAGMGATPNAMRAYASAETHTWVQKAADLSGLGTDSIRWIPTDAEQRLDLCALEEAIQLDRAAGDQPFLVIGAAGTVSTGAVDPLPAMAELCQREGLWFHVDGAYGGPAVAVPDAPRDLRGLREADSVAIDPHKWLYAPLEAGCILVRDIETLRDTFSYHPSYYLFDNYADAPVNYYELGPQNSRGFRALKVWLGLRQSGRQGYVRMISDDIALARDLFRAVSAHADLEAWTCSLSITTFRYLPADLRDKAEANEAYLSNLNTALLGRIQAGGEAFISNAVIDGVYLLRACIVNFRTSVADIVALPGIVARLGAEVDAELRLTTGAASE